MKESPQALNAEFHTHTPDNPQDGVLHSVSALVDRAASSRSWPFQPSEPARASM